MNAIDLISEDFNVKLISENEKTGHFVCWRSDVGFDCFVAIELSKTGKNKNVVSNLRQLRVDALTLAECGEAISEGTEGLFESASPDCSLYRDEKGILGIFWYDSSGAAVKSPFTSSATTTQFSAACIRRWKKSNQLTAEAKTTGNGQIRLLDRSGSRPVKLEGDSLELLLAVAIERAERGSNKPSLHTLESLQNLYQASIDSEGEPRLETDLLSDLTEMFFNVANCTCDDPNCLGEVFRELASTIGIQDLDMFTETNVNLAKRTIQAHLESLPHRSWVCIQVLWSIAEVPTLLALAVVYGIMPLEEFARSHTLVAQPDSIEQQLVDTRIFHLRVFMYHTRSDDATEQAEAG